MPLDETIQLSASDIRVLATVCFVNSLNPNQQHLLSDPKKFEFCFLSSQLIAQLDSCQHQLLVKSAFAETHFEFKFDSHFVQNLNSEVYHNLPMLQNKTQLAQMLTTVMSNQPLTPSQLQLVSTNVMLAILTLSYDQRTELLRELFTAIYAEGEATEAYKVLRSFVSYFDIGIEADSNTKFTYACEVGSLASPGCAELSLEHMLAVKTGDFKALPHKLLYSLFV